MKKVAELTGADLALWASRADGRQANIVGERGDARDEFCMAEPGGPFFPHEDWAHGGPLIEKHGGSLFRCGEDEAVQFWIASFATHSDDGFQPNQQKGPTPLIAAMRALVASVYGDSVGEVTA